VAVVRHRKGVLSTGKRATSFACLVVLTLSLSAPCAGWASTAEARLSCCMADGACPMHPPESPNSDGQSLVSQAAADSCCAASERTGATSSSGSAPTTIPLDPVVSPAAENPLVAVAWHADIPDGASLSPSHVPRHLLLSVFLV
jgi:hypothetical protein